MPKNATAYPPTRSIRVDNAIWDRAKARAEGEGITISQLVKMLVEGYADGHIPTPRTQVIYADTVEAATT